MGYTAIQTDISTKTGNEPWGYLVGRGDRSRNSAKKKVYEQEIRSLSICLSVCMSVCLCCYNKIPEAQCLVRNFYCVLSTLTGLKEGKDRGVGNPCDIFLSYLFNPRRAKAFIQSEGKKDIVVEPCGSTRLMEPFHCLHMGRILLFMYGPHYITAQTTPALYFRKELYWTMGMLKEQLN